MSEPPLLQVRAIGFSRGEKPVLKNISFELQNGEILVILGPSGCGKTSLLRCMNRLESVGEGEIYLQGKSAGSIPVCDLRRRVGMVFQNPALLPGTVQENISIGPGLDNHEFSEEKFFSLMEKLGIDPSLQDMKVSKLSAGERQRVSLAQVLANEPQVLMLDEPTSALDPAAALKVESLIQSFHSSLKAGILLVTHDINQAMRLNTRTLVLMNGEILGEGGNVRELMNSTQDHRMQDFFRGNLIPRQTEL